MSDEHYVAGDEASPEDQFEQLPPPLHTWDYPLWVKLAGGAIVLLVGYALLTLPGNIAAARKLHQAEGLEHAGKFAQAETEYAAVLEKMPTSRKGRIALAHAIFSDGDPKNDPAGLRAVEGMNLDNGEWAHLSAVMPSEYQTLFLQTRE